MSEKVFDIAIPVYKPDKMFGIMLQRLLQQEVLPAKIILLNTECEECTTESLGKCVEDIKARLLDRNTSVEFDFISLTKEQFDHGGTRHLATNYAKSDYILFMTQDAIPASRKLTKQMLEAFEEVKEPRVAVVYARQRARKNAKEAERITRLYNYPKESCVKTAADIETLGVKTFFCSDVCAMYDLKLYRMLGGFVRKTIFNEDMIYAAKAIDAAFAINYCAKAQVIHSHSYTYLEEFRRSFDMAVSQKQNQVVFAQVSSEREGFRFVKDSMKKLLRKGLIAEAIDFFVRCMIRYAAYLAGINFEVIPMKYRKVLSLNRSYWDNYEN